jgi:hypothetical protein
VDVTAIVMGLFAIIFGLIMKKNARKISERQHKFNSFLFGFKYAPDYIDRGEWAAKVGSYGFILFGLLFILLGFTKG